MNDTTTYTIIFGQCAAFITLIVNLRIEQKANARLRKELDEARAKLISQSVEHVRTLESLRDGWLRTLQKLHK